jgi:large subunit ribosomal protein L24e
MTSCSFCGGEVTPGTGKMYIKKDGTVWHFCKAKCQRNQVGLGRVNRHVGWTQAYSEHKGDRTHGAKTAAAKGAAKAAAKGPKAPVKAAPKATATAPAK